MSAAVANGGAVTTGLDPLGTVVATVRRRFCGTGPFDRRWFVPDCCGILCALLTYLLHMYGVYATCFVLIPPWMSYSYNLDSSDSAAAADVAGASVAQGTGSGAAPFRALTFWGHLHRTLFIWVAFLAVVSHFRAMTTDPGAVPPDAKPLEAHLRGESARNDKHGQDELLPPPTHLRMCRRCRAYKPPRAHHCSICRRCVIKMDHHCPWINNCCALGNHKYFLLFVFYTAIACAYSLSLIVWRFAACSTGSPAQRHRYYRDHSHQPLQQHHHQHCLDHPTDLLKVLGLLVESVLFGMFTLCMMCDQSGVVRSGLTHIDRLKGLDSLSASSSATGEEISGWDEVFGIPSSSWPSGRGPSSSPSRTAGRGLGSWWWPPCFRLGSLGAKKHRRNLPLYTSVAASTSSSSSAAPAAATTTTMTTLPPHQTRGFRLSWLSPFSPVTWGGAMDEVLGYCRPVTGSSTLSSATAVAAAQQQQELLA